MKNEVMEVSNQFWEALKKADADALRKLVYEDAKFVHMGVMLDREGEIDWAVTEKSSQKQSTWRARKSVFTETRRSC